jgi:glycosyltransferase involved in cell wall biosynthesis
MLNVSVILSVYIATEVEYNRTTTNLSWLILQDYSIGCYEVIVVNNASAYGFGVRLKTWCLEKGLKCIDYMSQRSICEARKAGVRVAQYPILAFIDSDCIPGPSWLHSGVIALEEFGGMISGHIEYTFQPEQLTLLEHIYPDVIRYLRYKQHALLGYWMTANLFTYREYFDDGELFLEQKNLGDWKKCRNSQIVVQYCEDAIVYYPAWSGLRRLLSKVVRQAGLIRCISPAGWCDFIRCFLLLRV